MRRAVLLGLATAAMLLSLVGHHGGPHDMRLPSSGHASVGVAVEQLLTSPPQHAAASSDESPAEAHAQLLVLVTCMGLIVATVVVVRPRRAAADDPARSDSSGGRSRSPQPSSLRAPDTPVELQVLIRV